MATYSLGKKFSGNKWVGLASSLTVMLYPKLFSWSLFCLSDVTYTFIFLLVVLFAVKGHDDRRYFYAMGAAIGLGYYAKGTSLLLVPAVILFYMVKTLSLRAFIEKSGMEYLVLDERSTSLKMLNRLIILAVILAIAGILISYGLGVYWAGHATIGIITFLVIISTPVFGLMLKGRIKRIKGVNLLRIHRKLAILLGFFVLVTFFYGLWVSMWRFGFTVSLPASLHGRLGLIIIILAALQVIPSLVIKKETKDKSSAQDHWLYFASYHDSPTDSGDTHGHKIHKRIEKRYQTTYRLIPLNNS